MFAIISLSIQDANDPRGWSMTPQRLRQSVAKVYLRNHIMTMSVAEVYLRHRILTMSVVWLRLQLIQLLLLSITLWLYTWWTLSAATPERDTSQRGHVSLSSHVFIVHCTLAMYYVLWHYTLYYVLCAMNYVLHYVICGIVHWHCTACTMYYDHVSHVLRPLFRVLCNRGHYYSWVASITCRM